MFWGVRHVTAANIRTLQTLQLDGKVLRDKKRCFWCLMNGHISKNCRTSYKFNV